MDGSSARLLALPPAVVADQSVDAIADACGYFAPDGVWVLATERAPTAHATVRSATDGTPVVHTPLARDSGPRHDRLGGGDADRLKSGGVDRDDDENGPGVDVVSVRDPSLLADVGHRLRDGALGPGTALEGDGTSGDEAAARGEATTFVVCPIEVSVDETRLSATLPAADELAELVAAAPGRVVVLSDLLPADYDHEWTLDAATGDERGSEDAASVRIHGLGATEGYGGRNVACLTLSSSGAVGTERVDADRFGLRALGGVGPTTANRLREAGIRSREDVRRTPLREVTDVRGVGRDTAERAKQHAEVLATGEPLRLTTDGLPGERAPRPPLCLDIETDGLSPSIIWQIGVYDPSTDEHRSFTERENPDEPGTVIEAFLLWLLGTHPDRDLLTWNGDRFDYRHLTNFVERYCPEYAAEWDDYWKHDLYDWAVRQEHALLPGRTNKLDHVARRLGYADADTGLDGAATAAAYERFVRTGEPPDWERHEAYCEDDCRALWHVYESLREADRRDGVAEENERVADSEQAGLGDF
ncbi:MAG: ribonuclease H-like domain-containing protein [Haloglomus sp.]